MDKRKLLPSSDKEPLKCSTICLVGQTRPLEPKAENTICWKVFEHLDQETGKNHNNFRSSEWGPEAADVMCKEIRDYPAVRGLKVGDLIDATQKEFICKVMIEEKLFETHMVEPCLSAM
ncbi:hypothetical protein BGX21_001132, partial [Mortierella sp. AD011]